MRQIFTALILLLLSACSSPAVQQPSYYLLRPDLLPSSGSFKPSANFALGDLHIAAYIDQPGMLLETAAGEVRAARHHLWAEPVQEGIHAFLGQEISRVSGENLMTAVATPSATRINIRIDQLHGTQDGRALLVAVWWLDSADRTPAGETNSAERFVEYEALTTDGYAALARAQKALLSALAAQIAAGLVPPTQ